jgi:membrane fusion protein (multidrug efflux system)
MTAEATPVAAKKSKRTPLLVLLGAGLLGGTAHTVMHRGLESTDDAQIDGEVVAVAARLGGAVSVVSFQDNEKVQAGKVLAEIDPAPAMARLAQAEANLEGARAALAAAETDAHLAATNAKASNKAATASLSAASAGASASRDSITEARARVAAAESNATQAKADLDRVQRLSATGALSPAQLEQTRTASDTAQANLAQAKANLSVLEAGASQAMSRVSEASAHVDQTRDVDAVVALADARAQGARARVAELEALRAIALIDMHNTKIYAPQDGYVSKKTVAVGQTIAVGTPIAQLVAASDVWVTANFKETQIAKMRVGQPVEIEVDAVPGALHGTVDSFSAATGARFALLPPDNATGNFTKVVQRLPVRIKIDAGSKRELLRPGMSVELTVDTRK